MNFKKAGIILAFLFLVENAFGYNYVKSFYDWRGDNVYKVCATNTAFTSSNYHLVQINDLENCISRCFVLPDKNSVMDMYQILSRMNTATLEETIRSTVWEYWFEAENGWLFYKASGLY